MNHKIKHNIIYKIKQKIENKIKQRQKKKKKEQEEERRGKDRKGPSIYIYIYSKNIRHTLDPPKKKSSWSSPAIHMLLRCSSSGDEIHRPQHMTATFFAVHASSLPARWRGFRVCRWRQGNRWHVCCQTCSAGRARCRIRESRCWAALLKPQASRVTRVASGLGLGHDWRWMQHQASSVKHQASSVKRQASIPLSSTFLSPFCISRKK